MTGYLRSQGRAQGCGIAQGAGLLQSPRMGMGTQLFDSLVERGYLTTGNERLTLTNAGANFIKEFGIDLGTLTAKRAPLCRECLDWSERRSHQAGSPGRALLTRFEELDWAKRDRTTRAMTFSKIGEHELNTIFNRTMTVERQAWRPLPVRLNRARRNMPTVGAQDACKGKLILSPVR